MKKYYINTEYLEDVCREYNKYCSRYEDFDVECERPSIWEIKIDDYIADSLILCWDTIEKNFGPILDRKNVEKGIVV